MHSRRKFLWLLGLSTAGALSAPLVDPQSLGQIQSLGQAPSLPKKLPHGQFAPRRGDVRIGIISDLNSQYGSTTYEQDVHQAIALLPDWKPDLVLCGGDMVAGQSQQLSTVQVKAMWQAFDGAIAAPLRNANIPFGVTIGNHDGSGAKNAKGFIFERDRTLAANYWNQAVIHCGLRFVDRAEFPFYYSFEQQGIFYLVWDASSATLSPQQLAWAQSSLAKAQSASMRIAIGHLPLYAVAAQKNKPGEFLNHAEKLRSLLERYNVHTYISGHHHAFYPGKKGNLKLLHAGALGGGPRQLIGSALPPIKTLSIVDIDQAAAETRYTTYAMKTMQVIDIRTLPRQITGVNGTIYRQDF